MFGSTTVFNPAALFICFRESMEAVIIVVVLLQFLDKTLAVTKEKEREEEVNSSSQQVLNHSDHQDADAHVPSPLTINTDLITNGAGAGAGARLTRIQTSRLNSPLVINIPATPTTDIQHLRNLPPTVSTPTATEATGLLEAKKYQEHQQQSNGSSSATAEQSSLLTRLRRHVWLGALSGLATACLVGGCLVFLIAYLKTDVLGDAGELWECAFELFAVVLQTYLAIKLITFTSSPTANTSTASMTAKWQRKIDRHMSMAAEQENQRQQQESTVFRPHLEYPFVILAFTVVLREGLESVIYLTGISAGDSPSSILIPGLLGIILAITTGTILHRASTHIDLRSLMVTSVTLMLVLSAGLLASVAAELEEYTFENLLGMPDNTRTWTVWDARWCCNENKYAFWQVLNALVGWQSRVTVLVLSVYLAYWTGVFAWVLFSVRKAAKGKAVTCVDDDVLVESEVQVGGGGGGVQVRVVQVGGGYDATDAGLSVNARERPAGIRREGVATERTPLL